MGGEEILAAPARREQADRDCQAASELEDLAGTLELARILAGRIARLRSAAVSAQGLRVACALALDIVDLLDAASRY